jgi:hypothetical protein
MRLKLALPLILMLGACASSPPVTPTTPGLCSDLSVIKYHAPKDFDPANPSNTWPDTPLNVFDTPETVKRILVHNARYKALCGGS